MLSVERDSKKSVVRFRQWYKPDEDRDFNSVKSAFLIKHVDLLHIW